LSSLPARFGHDLGPESRIQAANVNNLTTALNHSSISLRQRSPHTAYHVFNLYGLFIVQIP
jgi:hypothetical protein